MNQMMRQVQQMQAEVEKAQESLKQAAQELGPEGLGLDLAEIDPDHLAAPGSCTA